MDGMRVDGWDERDEEKFFVRRDARAVFIQLQAKKNKTWPIAVVAYFGS
jgi:hypothetical protein